MSDEVVSRGSLGYAPHSGYATRLEKPPKGSIAKSTRFFVFPCYTSCATINL